MKSKRIIWGIVLIAVGVLIALSSLGMLEIPAGISAWQIILGILEILVLIDGASKLDFAQSFLALGVELIIFEKPIGVLIGKSDENWISNWAVIGISLLVGIGFNLIFKDVKHKASLKRKSKDKTMYQMHAFGDHLRYIDSGKFKKEYIHNTFGDFEVRFENVSEYSGGGTLYIENKFGDVTVYVPSFWEVKVELDGDVHTDKELEVAYADDSATVLYIKGSNRFGDVYIRSVG